MLRSSSSSLLAFTVSLYWSRLSCRAPGPRDEHPVASIEATMIQVIQVAPPVTFAMRVRLLRGLLSPDPIDTI
jgi:hypothetical protein